MVISNFLELIISNAGSGLDNYDLVARIWFFQTQPFPFFFRRGSRRVSIVGAVKCS